MALIINAVTLAVGDLDRSKQFYAELGARIEQDQPQYVQCGLGDGSSGLSLYPRARSPTTRVWTRPAAASLVSPRGVSTA